MGVTSIGGPINRNYHADLQGSILAVSGAGGSVETNYHTDSWGNVISGSAVQNPHIYLGGLGYWQEPAVNLDYVRARWYEPSTGSWLSVDPVRSEPRYQYSHNSPTMRVDPSGTDSVGEEVRGFVKGEARAAKSAVVGIARRVEHAAENAYAAGKKMLQSFPKLAEAVHFGAMILRAVYDLAGTKDQIVAYGAAHWGTYVEEMAGQMDKYHFDDAVRQATKAGDTSFLSEAVHAVATAPTAGLDIN
jgi:RHS repeat-associated protein